jgi:electron transfer flavoprotein beta subunit
MGNETGDTADFQVGVRVGYALGRPTVTRTKRLVVADGRARCEQEVDGGRDVYDIPLPAVVAVLEGINLPRYPSVPGRLRARSKPVETSDPARPAQRLEMRRLVVPAGNASTAEVLGTGADAAPAVVDVIASLGLL